MPSQKHATSLNQIFQLCCGAVQLHSYLSHLWRSGAWLQNTNLNPEGKTANITPPKEAENKTSKTVLNNAGKLLIKTDIIFSEKSLNPWTFAEMNADDVGLLASDLIRLIPFGIADLKRKKIKITTSVHNFTLSKSTDSKSTVTNLAKPKIKNQRSSIC